MSRDNPNRKRKHAHLIYLSDAEEVMLKERMKRVNSFSFADYARKMLIDGYVLVIDDSKELRAYTYEINKIGNNINQIAYALNSGQTVSKETIDELKKMMDIIWQSQRYILSATPY